MLEDYFFKKNTKWVLWGAFALIVALLIFHAGVVVGSHQPMRGRVAIGDGPGLLGSIMPQDGYVESGHGAVGTIATVTLPTFTMQTRGGDQQEVETDAHTIITGSIATDTSALKTGEVVIIIGDPDTTQNGYIDARLIHILPPPPSSSSPSPAAPTN